MFGSKLTLPQLSLGNVWLATEVKRMKLQGCKSREKCGYHFLCKIVHLTMQISGTTYFRGFLELQNKNSGGKLRKKNKASSFVRSTFLCKTEILVPTLSSTRTEPWDLDQDSRSLLAEYKWSLSKSGWYPSGSLWSFWIGHCLTCKVQ